MTLLRALCANWLIALFLVAGATRLLVGFLDGLFPPPAPMSPEEAARVLARLKRDAA